MAFTQATLFSAVLTTFVVATLPSLQPDENAKILRQILLAIQNNGTAPDDTFHPATSDVRVNVLWITSLILSISTSFMAILAKQWIYNLRVDTSPLPVNGGRQRQYRLDGLRAWKLPHIITSLPVLLHVSVLLFFAGLLEYLWNINQLVAAVTSGFVGVTVLVYCSTSLLCMIFPSCPYKTSLTTLIFDGIDSSLESVFTMIMSVWTNLNRTAALVIERSLSSDAQPKPTENKILSNSQMDAMAQELDAGDFGASTWRFISPLFLNPKKREDVSIEEAKPRLDAAVLAWMVERSSKLEDVSSIAKELYHFEGLLAQRMLFLESDAVTMLVRHLHSLCSAGTSADGSAEEAQIREEMFETMDALLQLTTETRDVDSPTTSFLGRGYPYFHEFLNVRFYTGGLSNSPLIRPGSDLVNPFQSHLYFAAAALRLNLAISYEDDWKEYNISQSVDDFYDRVSANSCAELKGCSDRSLRTVIDTIIFVGLHATNFDLSDLTSTDLVHQSLRLLSNISANVPSLSYAAQRQICWAIWALAYGLDESHTLLSVVFKHCACVVPRLTNSGDWAEHFAGLLKVTNDKVVLEATMIVMEGLLYSRQTVDRKDTDPVDVDEEDYERLCDTFAAAFPTFLANYVASLCKVTNKTTITKKHDDEKKKEHTTIETTFDDSTPIFIKRLIKIAGYLAFYHREHQSSEDAILIRDSLELLTFVTSHRHTPPFREQAWVDHWLWSILCKITALQLRDKGLLQSTRLSIEEFASENTGIQSIAMSFISILRACSEAQIAPSSALSESVTTMLKVLREVLRKSLDDTRETVELRNVLLGHDIVAVIGALRRGQYNIIASEVLNTISP